MLCSAPLYTFMRIGVLRGGYLRAIVHNLLHHSVVLIRGFYLNVKMSLDAARRILARPISFQYKLRKLQGNSLMGTLRVIIT